jgi:dTDP-glucose pyrophosphorylase
MRSERAKRLAIPATASIRETMAVIDREGLGLAVVVGEDGGLAGIATDGDIRRGLLRGAALTDVVTKVMNARPASCRAGTPREEMAGLMRARGLRQLPVVEERGRLVDVVVFSDFLRRGPLEITAVLMAGGRGDRLRPMTDKVPKPMLPVGGRPILEIILRQLASCGIRDFVITTWFLPERIQEHFGDGSAFGVRIKYLQEEEALGTAGALSLLGEEASDPVLVMNGDVLTRLDFGRMVDYHRDRGAEMTVAVRRYAMQIPYGLVRLEQQEIAGFEEKPVLEYPVSGGIYLLSRSGLALIPERRPCDMPQVVELLLSRGRRVVAFPIEDYWIDIGRVSDFERAAAEAARWEAPADEGTGG